METSTALHRFKLNGNPEGLFTAQNQSTQINLNYFATTANHPVSNDFNMIGLSSQYILLLMTVCTSVSSIKPNEDDIHPRFYVVIIGGL